MQVLWRGILNDIVAADTSCASMQPESEWSSLQDLVFLAAEAARQAGRNTRGKKFGASSKRYQRLITPRTIISPVYLVYLYLGDPHRASLFHTSLFFLALDPSSIHSLRHRHTPSQRPARAIASKAQPFQQPLALTQQKWITHGIHVPG